MKLVIDIIASLLFCSTITIVLVCQSSAVLSVFVIGGIYSAKVLCDDTNWEVGFTDWFIVSKTTTTVFGVILMNTFRQHGWYTKNTHCITLFFLDLNIIEAMLREFESGYYANSAVAVVLMSMIPYSISVYELQILTEETSRNNLFVFPLHIYWILLYTTWNACFSYGCSMSSQTRLILVPPLIVGMYDIKLWLGARVLSLLLHLILRVSQAVWFYRPGDSLLTPVAGTIENSRTICHFWGVSNLIILGVFYLISHLPS